MKREKLIELQVPEESIQKIMDINGADIEKVRLEVKAKEQQLQQVQDELTEANSQIAEFKNMDIESIQKSCDEWEQKAKQAEVDKAKFIYESKVAGFVKSLKLKDDIYENHVTQILLDKELQFDGDTLIGADDVIKPFKESHPDAFQDEKEKPKFVDVTGKEHSIQLTKEDFRKMGYQERRTLKAESPEIYESLKE